MTKDEIRGKFDEIVAFSEVEQFIDTPVKRYSSGMQVRLAFAVAAHLEPEILIVDEVLAVGDAAFQKKCLGKMRNVVGEGRTVLFVSHNMTAMRALCLRAMLLHSGRVVSSGDVDLQIERYHSLSRTSSADNGMSVDLGPRLTLSSVTLLPSPVSCGGTARFIVKLRAKGDTTLHQCALLVYSPEDARVGIVDLRAERAYRLSGNSTLILKGEIEEVLLVEGTYHIGLYLNADGFKGDLRDLTRFHVSGQPPFRNNVPFASGARGFVEFKSLFSSGCE